MKTLMQEIEQAILDEVPDNVDCPNCEHSKCSVEFNVARLSDTIIDIVLDKIRS